MKCRYCKRETPDTSNFCMNCGQPLIKFRGDLFQVKVPEPVLLPSGKWRIQLRKERISIVEDSADVCREKARLARRKWREEEVAGLHLPPPKKLLLGDAIDSYIDSKSNIRSPSTLRSYRSYRKFRFQECMSWDMNDRSLNWQMAVNKEAALVSPKTVFNAWHLITATFKAQGLTPPIVSLPRRPKKERSFLSFAQIKQFMKAVEGTDVELGALLALSSLRHSEIIALRPSDVSPDGKTLRIRGSRVLNSYGQYEYKELTKTEKSTRDIAVAIPRLQELLADAAKSDGEWIFDWTEKRMYDHINRACRKAGLPEIGVHGLRHTFASLAYHLDLKKKSTETIGGWSNSTIVDSVYTHNADLDTDVEKIEEFYKSLFS